MDESGILSLLNVELMVEKLVTAEAEEESPFSKLGSTISKLFGGEGTDEKPVVEKPVHEEPPPSTPKSEKKEEKKPQEEPEQKKNETEANKNKTKEAEKSEVKPKVVILKEPIPSTAQFLSVPELTKIQFEESVKKLEKLNAIEKEFNRRATALNNLESFVIDVQNKLYEDDYSQAATEEEIEKIRSACSETSDWLYEDGSDADADTYEKKLASLRSLTRELYGRVFEHKERPEALAALKSMLNGSRNFLESAKNLTKSINPDKDVFTDVEIETLQKLIKETEDWRDKQVEEQNKVKKSDPVKLTVKALTEKMSLLDREVKYLVNKIKLWKPKKLKSQRKQR